MKTLITFLNHHEYIKSLIIVGLFALLFKLYESYKQRKYIKEALIKADLADEKITNNKTKKIISFYKFRNKIVITKFNKAKSTIDFSEKKQLLAEIFQKEIIKIIRIKNKIYLYLANWNYKIKLDMKNVLFGFDGESLIKKDQDEANSMFIFGLSGSSKSTFVRSIINQIKRIYTNSEVIIFSPKPADFPNFNVFDESQTEDFLNSLKELENKRAEAEKNKTKLDKKYLIVADEAHILNENKEICEILNKLILIGRSQKIDLILSSQKGTTSDYKNLHISQTKVKICMRNTESLSFAKTIFSEETARDSFFNLVPIGFGFIKTPSISGRKIKFYYE